MSRLNKYVLLALLSVGIGVHGQKPFKIIDAYKVASTGGIAQAGSTVIYEIRVLQRSRDSIVFTGLWVGRDKRDYQLWMPTTLPYYKPVKGDTLILHTQSIPTTISPPPPPLPPPPVVYKGAALIQYVVKGKVMYSIVKEVKTHPEQKGY